MDCKKWLLAGVAIAIATVAVLMIASPAGAVKLEDAIAKIKAELEERLPELGLVESHRLKQRTLYDIEMIEETGYCKGIENYSRHLDGRKKGDKPYCLLDYFKDDFLIFIDESHRRSRSCTVCITEIIPERKRWWITDSACPVHWITARCDILNSRA